MILKLEFNNEREIEVLINLINEAIKSKGLEGGAAKAGVYFQEMILKAIEESKKIKETINKENV